MNTEQKERFIEKWAEMERKRRHEEWLDEMIADIEPTPKFLKWAILAIFLLIIWVTFLK